MHLRLIFDLTLALLPRTAVLVILDRLTLTVDGTELPDIILLTESALQVLIHLFGSQHWQAIVIYFCVDDRAIGIVATSAREIVIHLFIKQHLAW